MFFFRLRDHFAGSRATRIGLRFSDTECQQGSAASILASSISPECEIMQQDLRQQGGLIYTAPPLGAAAFGDALSGNFTAFRL